MKIVICYMGYAGYTAVCWRELASRPGVSLKVYAKAQNYGYDLGILDGLDVTVVPEGEFRSSAFQKRLTDEIVAYAPDVIFVDGWASPAYVQVVRDARLKHVRKILCMDTMWEWKLRTLLARPRVHSYVKRFDAAMVAGDRGRTFAQYIGFRGDQIFTGFYGYDERGFEVCYSNRLKGAWPRRFVFVGRLVPIKGLDTLIAAFERYRAKYGEEAWELVCYGKGSLRERLLSVPGVSNPGFIQPGDLPRVLTDAGAFVLPSMKDPWGVALAEGAGAGLPLIASDTVSCSLDVLRHRYNGFVFPAGDIDRLFEALCFIHEKYDQLPEMGRISRMYATAYSPRLWADRQLEAAR